MSTLLRCESKRWGCVLVAVLTFGCTSSMATSRIGAAVVSESKGLPCFSIPASAETSEGVPLRALVVSEIQTGDWRTLPDVLWSFRTAIAPARPLLRPKDCIRYGEAPGGSTQSPVTRLKPFHVYYVNVIAKSEDSSMIGYVAKFCLKPDSTGKVVIQLISPDERGGSKRYDVCLPPK